MQASVTDQSVLQQGPTNAYQEADRLQQLQQAQQQQQQQQQRSADVEAARGIAASSSHPATAVAEPVASHAASPSPQELTGLHPLACSLPIPRL